MKVFKDVFCFLSDESMWYLLKSRSRMFLMYSWSLKGLCFWSILHVLYLKFPEAVRLREPSLFFAITCFIAITYKNYKVLFEAELIINNAPLTYVYPNTIETYLTTNHLLIGIQLYSSNTTSVYKKTASVIIFVIDGDLNNVVNLRETERTTKSKYKLSKN